MNQPDDLSRFLKAQEQTFAQALSEIQAGRKRSHWMWFIFPQLRGLGFSETSRFYGLSGTAEAMDYYSHPVLGKRLVAIASALLQLSTSNATQVMGSPDDLKLRSSMTLFASLPGTDPVFHQVLDHFFEGKMDERTLALMH